jgi:rsbT co-antagonist protein RsbR
MTEEDARRIERVIELLAKAASGDLSSRVDVEEGAHALIVELEIGVNLLFDDLALSRALSEERQRKIEAQSHRIVSQQRELVEALSTPAIMVWSGVIALPIIGEVDDHRAQAITETILTKVVAERATHVILDLTGAGNLGVDSARSLLRMANAIFLLGAKCLITGIGPHTAASMSSLQLDLSKLHTCAHLSDALALVLRQKKVLGSEGN